jgi:GYF domain 2
VDSASEKTSRWFVTHQNERSGPYSWRALLALASRGDLDPDAMLIKEHSERWLRARSLHALFTAAPGARTADPVATPPQQPQCIQPNRTNPAAVAQPGEAEAQDVQRLRARRGALEATMTPLVTPAKEPASFQAPAGARRSIWDRPWVMEGLAAASISVLLGLSIFLGYYAFARMSLRGPRPASPEQQVASPVPDAGR